MNQFTKRVEALEKALNAGGGHCHIILARDEEDAERQKREIKEWDPEPKCFFMIEGLAD